MGNSVGILYISPDNNILKTQGTSEPKYEGIVTHNKPAAVSTNENIVIACGIRPGK